MRLLLPKICLIVAVNAMSSGAAKPKPVEVTVLEIAVHRENGLITIDTRVKNSGVRKLQSLTVIFRFLAESRSVVTTQHYDVDDKTLEPGDEAEIHAQLKDAARAVDVQVLASEDGDRILHVGNAGPFAIE